MKIVVGIYEMVIRFGEFLKHFLLLSMRLFWGYSFFEAGINKFSNVNAVLEFFQGLQIPFPLFNVYLVGIVETFGGLFLMIGLASRLVALPLAITMVVALLTAHGKPVWEFVDAIPQIAANLPLFMANAQKVVEEAPFNYLLTSLIVLCVGPGNISIDYVLFKFYQRQ